MKYFLLILLGYILMCMCPILTLIFQLPVLGLISGLIGYIIFSKSLNKYYDL